MKKAIYRTLGLAILVAGGWYGYHYYKQMPERQDQIPTAKVQRGDVVIRAFSRGELRAARTVTLTAPNLFGTVHSWVGDPGGRRLVRLPLLQADAGTAGSDSNRQSATWRCGDSRVFARRTACGAKTRELASPSRTRRWPTGL